MSESTNIESVESLRELEDAARKLSGGGDFCFRGHSKSDWRLIPTAYRYLEEIEDADEIDFDTVAMVERDTYRAFQIEAQKHLRDLTMLERLSVARHYGVPTRFLDWSQDLTVSTFFAVAYNSEVDAAIWLFNLRDFPFPPILGRQHRGGGFRLENIEKYGQGFAASFAQDVSKVDTWLNDIDGSFESSKEVPEPTFLVWKPARNDERLSRQNGLLSWYHTFNDTSTIWDYEAHIRDIESRHGKKLLHKIVIPKEFKTSILGEIVDGRGIDEHRLFGDLQGLGASLARIHDRDLKYYLAG